MKSFLAAIVISAAILTGCGGRLDSDPTIFGFTPALRAEMRELVAANDPAADPDKVVTDYMNKLKKHADAMKVKPNAAGDYELPPEQQKAMDAWLSKSKGQSTAGSVKTIVDEFSMDLPNWAEPLVEDEASGTITPERQELLVKVVLMELQIGLSK